MVGEEGGAGVAAAFAYGGGGAREGGMSGRGVWRVGWWRHFWAGLVLLRWKDRM